MIVTIITSASYISDELSAEFGVLPPSFLPVGHKRLYDLQVEILGSNIFLTLPISFQLPTADANRLTALDVTVVRVPDDLKLGESVLYALEVIGKTCPIRILHGDTIIYDTPFGDNVIALADSPESYTWGNLSEPKSELTEVLAGYFVFRDAEELRRSLALSRGDFVTAVKLYDAVVPLVRQKVNSWLDFGHLQTYYRSRCSMRTQRSFNDLSITYDVVEKRSVDQSKLAAEASWFENLPTALRLFAPAFLGREVDRYSIEYLPIPTLHEMFVFGTLGDGVWRKILGSCFEFMRASLEAGQSLGGPCVLHQLTTDKTEVRLEEFCSSHGIPKDLNWRYKDRPLPSLIDIARQTSSLIDMSSTNTLGIMHGDLCFTNIFYDFRTQRIKVIDPRGSAGGGIHTVLGDTRYDMAKLNHSIVGAYDFILAGRYACEGFSNRNLAIDFPTNTNIEQVSALSQEFELGGLFLTDPQITAITIHLFLSMLPLHADRPERQQAFLANALRLFAERIDA